MIEYMFNSCVRFLCWLAALLGVSYEEVNVWIFCIIWPVFTLILIQMVVMQYLYIRKLNRKLE